ncbi:MAG: DUF2007 domain-containing protein [Verrucomicrobiota bacterium]
MKEVYSHYDFARVGYYKSILEEAGIQCFVRNQNAELGPLGGVLSDSIPSLCVMDPDNHRIAKQILSSHEFPEEEVVTIPAWTCNCGADVPEGYDSCWSCGMDLPEPQAH